MEKSDMPDFDRIPQLTKSASYRVNIPWATLEKTLERYQNLDIDPPFQRAHVWSRTQRIRYVEYILRGGISGRDIFFNQADWMTTFAAPMYLVDGKQRLQSVRLFLSDRLAIFGGYFLSDFSGSLPWDADFVFHVNDLKTYPEVLQWYIDLNDGGVAHTSSEIDAVRKLLDEALKEDK